ncbi:hypothetical protein KK083_20500 [Fulvivirgaceae bacterium PWU4]|uniref:Uncharacterized protein n=1 Tax=Chryseosolibacter histidini TaxID=2782349 RepID=A0AAP2DPQ1_9BACT|nr:hypothetical protein [Chryseosolibacter histidini]MBT1699289.1 hypothetical protein [Chryseosolibacter histidini]
MPFIDFHKLEGITVEDLKNAHIADLTAQDKYGLIEQLLIEFLNVRFHFERSTIFDQDATYLVLRTSYLFSVSSLN